MSNEITTNMRKRCLTPATGQHLGIIYDSGNPYYYVVYKNRFKSAYLAYSTDGITWTAEKLLIKAAGLTVVYGISLALDHTNKKIYAVYSEVGVSGSDIKVAVIDCSTPSNPVLGSEYIVTGYSNYYDMPVCALGVDGGLHVGAIRYNFGGVTTNYYVVKSGITAVQPNLTSWSSVFSLGHNNHVTNFGNMKIAAHPDNNKLVVFCIVGTQLSRSVNSTGAWNGWTVLDNLCTGADTLNPPTTYGDSIITQPYDICMVSGWNYAYMIHQHSTSTLLGRIYDFMGDTGIGDVISYFTIQSGINPAMTYYNDVGVAACRYPGDYHAHFFYEMFGSTRALYSSSYSYSEVYLTPSAVLIETGVYDPSCITSVWYPPGIYGDKVCFLELDK